MSNNLTSSITLELQIEEDDKSKDVIRAFDKSLKDIGKVFKQAATGDELTKSLEEAQEVAQAMINKFHESARNQDLDFQSISKAYAKNASKAISELEKQYAKQKDLLDEVQQQHKKLQERIEAHKKGIAEENLSEEAQAAIKKRIQKLEEEQTNLGLERLQSQIKQNRQLRANLKAAEQSARMERANAKYEKLKELQAKRKATTDKAERKDLSEKIKQQKLYIKAIEQAERATRKATEQTGKLGKAWEFVLKHAGRIGKATQFVTNVSNQIGGAARTVTGGAKAAASLLGGGLNAATQAADREVDKERQANRIKGFNKDDAKEILGELYIRTGSNDYGSIVDAINKVQGTLGKLSKEDLIAATEMEIRYPGMSVAFASSSYGADLANYNEYAAQLNAIQSATGASDEQIATSIRKFSNRKDIDASGGAISDYQAVYLALQNSGAFETEEEAEQAFNVFLKKQKASKQSVMEYAQSHDWTAGIHNDRDKLQVKNAMANMDWETFSKKLETAQASPSEGLQKSQSEQMAIQMRKVEEQKNKLLMTLIPAALPLVEAIAKMLGGGGAQLIADGLNDLFTIVVPVLLKVLNMLNDYILSPLLGLIKKLMDWLGEDNPRNDDDIVLPSSTSKNANGGIVWGTSIVGERGPEAIIPLDYSRAQRAENIAYSIQNNFSMSGNETTALSLAQAVSSRDFSRAMGKAAFKAGRLGAF